MTKVYGTGLYDFKRHHVAENPLEYPVEAKPGSALPSWITLLEIQRDRLTMIAADNWSRTLDASKPKKPFETELVKVIYRTELSVEEGQRRAVPSQRVMILEFRENVAAWACFYDRKDVFKGFLERVLRLKSGRELNIAEKTNYLVFMINAFQSLEDEIVSDTVLRLASLQSWHSLSYGRFQMELCFNPDLIRKKRMIKREAKEAAKRGEPFDPSTTLEVQFLRNLIEEFLEILDSKVLAPDPSMNEDYQLADAMRVDDACVLYWERFMEFLIDLLSQLPTRRYLRSLVSDVAVVAKCHLSALYRHEKGKLFAQLVDLLQFYEGFEINDHVGTQLTDDEVLQSHYERVQSFQLLAFSVFPLKLVSKDDPWSERVDFLIEVMVSFFEKQQSQK